MSVPPTVVLVHGAFADASGFAGLIGELRAAGVDRLVAPPNPCRSLIADAEGLARVVGAIDGPVVLLGHSYGGAVISQASAEVENVVGLVYLAAFAPDIGESLAGIQEAFPPSLLASAFYPTPYDAPGAAGGPDLYIARDRFRETFAADVPVAAADVMWVTQRPVSLAAWTESATAAGWREKPSWFLIARRDNVINPDAQRFMARRAGATTEEIEGSHTVFVSQPVRAAAFVLTALAG